METPIINPPEPKSFERVKQITPSSKYLTLSLLVILPFVGGYVGFLYGQSSQTYTTLESIEQEQPEATASTVQNTANNSDTGSIAISTEREEVPATGVKKITANGLTLEITFASSTAQLATIRNGEQVVQTLTLPTENLRTGYCIQENQILSEVLPLQDINFDGYLDLGALSSEGGAHCAYDSYIYYIFDPVTKQFASSSPLTLGPVTADPQKKTLTFLSRMGIDWQETVYYYRNGMYYLGEETMLYTDSSPQELTDLGLDG